MRRGNAIAGSTSICDRRHPRIALSHAAKSRVPSRAGYSSRSACIRGGTPRARREGRVADLPHKPWSFRGRGDTPYYNERFLVPATHTAADRQASLPAAGSAMNALERRARAAVDTQPAAVDPGEMDDAGTTVTETEGVDVDALGEDTLLELIGSLDRVPHLAVDASCLRGLPVDHRAGFLLAEIDGQLDMETLVDVSGMPRLDTLRILFRLLEDGIVRVR
jgi:hypothetical protein